MCAVVRGRASLPLVHCQQRYHPCLDFQSGCAHRQSCAERPCFGHMEFRAAPASRPGLAALPKLYYCSCWSVAITSLNLKLANVCIQTLAPNKSTMPSIVWTPCLELVVSFHWKAPMGNCLSIASTTSRVYTKGSKVLEAGLFRWRRISHSANRTV